MQVCSCTLTQLQDQKLKKRKEKTSSMNVKSVLSTDLYKLLFDVMALSCCHYVCRKIEGDEQKPMRKWKTKAFTFVFYLSLVILICVCVRMCNFLYIAFLRYSNKSKIKLCLCKHFYCVFLLLSFLPHIIVISTILLNECVVICG